MPSFTSPIRKGSATVLPRLTRSVAPTKSTAKQGKGRAGAVVWTIQGVLSLLFLFAGGMKLITPVAVLAQQSHLPGSFMKFIGICEFLGAIGLVLPGLVRIRTGLTPLAAAGLVIIMTGATVVTVVQGPIAGAVVPAVVGMLAAYISYNRWSRTTQPATPEPVVLDKAA
jgi:hypothetical protein